MSVTSHFFPHSKTAHCRSSCRQGNLPTQSRPPLQRRACSASATTPAGGGTPLSAVAAYQTVGLDLPVNVLLWRAPPILQRNVRLQRLDRGFVHVTAGRPLPLRRDAKDARRGRPTMRWGQGAGVLPGQGSDSEGSQRARAVRRRWRRHGRPPKVAVAPVPKRCAAGYAFERRGPGRGGTSRGGSLVVCRPAGHRDMHPYGTPDGELFPA